MNLWKTFKGLLPTDPLLVGTVASHNADGTSTVTLPGGGVLVALGQDVDVGLLAFVQTGRVQGVAPALTTETIEI